MNVKDAIKKRRSVRAYKNRPVADRLIKEIVDAARLAPSGHNTQPWRFDVIQSKKTFEELKKQKVFYQDFVYSVPAIISCSADPINYKRTKGWDAENRIRAIRDLSIASAFLVLRAQELNIGTCFIGWVQPEKLKKILKIPKRFVLPYVITLGYPNQKPGKHKRKSLSRILRFV